MIFYRSLPRIQAISFDLDDTLYDNHPIILNAEKSLNDLLALHYPKAAVRSRSEIMAIKHQLISNDPRLASDMGELRKHTLTHILRDDAATEIALNNAVEHCYNHFYTARSQLILDKTVHSCLSRLQQKVPLVAITNGNIDTQAVGLNHYFDFVLHASLTRPRKPFPDMFAETASRLKLAPKHILHVGDGMTNDVFGGYKAGFSTAWLAVNRPMQLDKESVKTLPDVQLEELCQLEDIVAEA